MKRHLSKKIFPILFIVILILGCFHYLTSSKEYAPQEDELVLHIQLNTDDEVGLIVYDYEIEDHQYSGDISNADSSLIKQGEDNIVLLKQSDLNCLSQSFDFSIQIRIINEYVQPNFENIYDEDITEYTYPITFNAEFGNSYYISVIGNKQIGYKANKIG